MRNLVIFDGSNFYHFVKRLNSKIHLTYFNYIKFCKLLTKQKTGTKIIYCIGEIKQNKKSIKVKNLYSNQQRLFHTLRNQNIIIKKGFMLKTKGVFHEKGVDVRIAVELLRGALKDEYDCCYLVSSDSDLIPAIKDSLKEGKQIIYVGFNNHLSKALSKNCSSFLSIDSYHILKCV